jgi:hypothetical protein
LRLPVGVYLANFHTITTTTPKKEKKIEKNKKEKRKGGAKCTKVLETNVYNHHMMRPKNKKVQKLSYLDNEFLEITRTKAIS